MAPLLEMTDNGNNPVTTPEVPLVQLTEAGKEISRASRQRQIQQELIASKSKLSKDVNTVKKILGQYQADFPNDDLSNEVQLEDAAEVVRV